MLSLTLLGGASRFLQAGYYAPEDSDGRRPDRIGAAHSLRGEVALQLGADARARPVQEDALMELSDAEQRADFLRVPAFHVAKKAEAARELES